MAPPLLEQFLRRRRGPCYALTAVYRYLYTASDGEASAVAGIGPTRHSGVPQASQASRRIPATARARGSGTQRLEANGWHWRWRTGDTNPHETEHRACYVARFLEGIYVLHAFEKRTRKTSRGDLELARTRYRELLEHRRKQGYGKG